MNTVSEPPAGAAVGRGSLVTVAEAVGIAVGEGGSPGVAVGAACIASAVAGNVGSPGAGGVTVGSGGWGGCDDDADREPTGTRVAVHAAVGGTLVGLLRGAVVIAAGNGIEVGCISGERGS